jgi:hypothetical protein
VCLFAERGAKTQVRAKAGLHEFISGKKDLGKSGNLHLGVVTIAEGKYSRSV